MPNKILKILMISAEVAPLAKVGGLADVIGSLPSEIKKLGPDVRLIMPLYGFIDKKKYGLKILKKDLMVPSGRLLIKTNIWKALLPKTNVPIYFIDAPEYFDHKQVYIKENNSERFLFFSMAALKSLSHIKFIPDIIHCHDFHTALIPDLLKTNTEPHLKHIKTIYTIHNFNYQGKTDPQILSTANLHTKSLKSLTRDARNGDINFMVQGILNADLLTTVSPSYAEEITESAFGAGLERLIRRRKNDLFGILNGIDTNLFDPSSDKLIEKKYSSKNLLAKKINKRALQKELGLPIDDTKPLVAVVSRLVWQKGLDLITSKFADLDCQFVFLGTGDKKYEDQLKNLAKRFPKNFSANIFFDLNLAQKIYASSDIFLMPSRFEPCGLGQMIAMRYGSVPLVRETGGLIDSVIGLKYKKVHNIINFINHAKANGFSFYDIDSETLYRLLGDSIKIYSDYPEVWGTIMKNGMKADFSWKKSAKEYLRLYNKVVKVK